MKDLNRFGYLIVRTFLFPIILTTGDVNISSSFSEMYKTTILCNVTEIEPSINCSLTLVISDNNTYSGGGCHEYQNNFLTIVLNPDTTVTSFECISEKLFAINWDFGKTNKPQLQFTKFVRERICPNYSNRNTYLYKTKMVIPDNQAYGIERKQTSSIVYTLSTLNYTNLKMRIRFFIQSWDSFTMHKEGPFRSINGTLINFFDVPEKTVIYAKECIIYVPCFSVKRINLFKVGTEDSNKSLVNMSIISYNSVEGFRVNIQKIWKTNATLICMVPDIGNDRSKCVQGANCLEFRLRFPEEIQFEPRNRDILFLYDFQTSETSLSILNNLLLECSSTKSNITIRSRNGTEVWENHHLTYTHYEVSEPEHRYFADVEVPNFLLKDFVDNYSQIHWDCFDSETTIHSWKLLAHQMEITYEAKEEKFICKSLGGVKMVQLQCDNINECLHYWQEIEFDPKEIKGLQLMEGTHCSVNGIISSCVSTAGIQNAIAFCYHPFSTLNVPPSRIIYFRGFNGIIYTQSDVPKKAIIKLDNFNPESYILLGQNVTFRCEGHSFFHERGIRWLVEFINESVVPLPKDIAKEEGFPEKEDINNPLSIVRIWFKDKNIKAIICAVPLLNSKEWQFATMDIQKIVHGRFSLIQWPPKILATETMKELGLVDKGENLTCIADGHPTPTVQWFRNKAPIRGPLTVVDKGPANKVLIFPEYNDEMKGEYTCTATNEVGFETKSFFVSTKGGSPESPSIAIGIILATVFLVIILIALISTSFYLLRRLRTSKDSSLSLTNAEMDEFFIGTEIFHITRRFSDAFTIPYNPAYELTKDSFEINHNCILGTGEYGTVYKGRIHQYEGEFAFKTLRNNSSKEALKGLQSELKILMYIEKHENVLKLVGAYTKEIQKGVLYIVTELCALGSLRSHLKRIKQDISENFTDEGFLNPSMFSKCLQWSAEIANGMEYLSFKHIVHSDLATRNILLTEDEVAKISDFGLSRRMYNYCNYVKKNKKDALPWKWMAIESLRELHFSTQSDIWAFGITVWEIFSLGDIPYPGISWGVEFVDLLDQGLRNQKPKYATDKLYEILLACWNKVPSDRPEFHDLRYFFLDYKNDLGSNTVEQEEKSENIYM